MGKCSLHRVYGAKAIEDGVELVARKLLSRCPEEQRHWARDCETRKREGSSEDTREAESLTHDIGEESSKRSVRKGTSLGRELEHKHLPERAVADRCLHGQVERLPPLADSSRTRARCTSVSRSVITPCRRSHWTGRSRADRTTGGVPRAAPAAAEGCASRGVDARPGRWP